MQLDDHGSDDAYWTVRADQLLDGDAPQVAIGTQATWHQTEWEDETPARVRRCRLLVAGSAAPVTTGAVVVPLGAHRTWVRTPDGPRHVVREASRIFCQ
jgi:coenzyme F420-reducing hydrogenase beta subunit